MKQDQPLDVNCSSWVTGSDHLLSCSLRFYKYLKRIHTDTKSNHFSTFPLLPSCSKSSPLPGLLHMVSIPYLCTGILLKYSHLKTLIGFAFQYGNPLQYSCLENPTD